MVKVAGRLAIVFFLFSFMILEVHGQKYMSISDDLYENSDRFDVGRRFEWVTVMSRYHFKSFEVFRIKRGTLISSARVSTTTTYWSGHSKFEEKQGNSFGFASDRGDTALVHFVMANYVESFGRRDVVQEHTYNLSALIETNDQNSEWKLTIRHEYGVEMGGKSTYFGWLKNGERRIEIVPVFNYQNPGTLNLADMIVGSEIWLKGFEFVENDRAIGAVQAAPKRSMSVWFSRQNEPMTDFVIGSTFAVLLHEIQSGLRF